VGGRRKIVVVLAVLATNLSARNTPNQRKGIAKAKNGCFEVELAVDNKLSTVFNKYPTPYSCGIRISN
jgi:hypothetical protein